jgi:hypothetical protein
MKRTPEYKAWDSMRQRCYNRRCRNYKNYGGRGITVCPRWRRSFEAFFADMGRKPSAHHSIERKNNARGYTPSNCRWATRLEQARNRRSTHYLTIGGERQCITYWMEQLGVPYHRLLRLSKKEARLTLPVPVDPDGAIGDNWAAIH